jgi:hypothetical protein
LVIAWPVVSRPVIPGAVVAVPIAIARLIVALPIVPLLIFSWPLIAATFVTAFLAIFAAVIRPFPINLCNPIAFHTAFILEVDVISRGESVTAHDVADLALRLDGSQHAEIMFGVLLIALRQHPVARRQRVTSKLLVFFKHMLCGASDLDPVRPV